MIQIILISHGDFGKQLLASAQMITGTVKNVYAVSLSSQETPEKLEKEINNLLAVQPGGASTLFLIDVFGGTPFNVSVPHIKNENVEIITGVNLPILIEAIISRDNNPLCTVSELAAHVLENGKDSIKNVKSDFQLKGQINDRK